VKAEDSYRRVPVLIILNASPVIAADEDKAQSTHKE
jgi:hypothetical protein